MRRFRGLTIFTILVAAVVLGILWLPFPAPLQTPLLGTPTLLDIRGREIAELSSPEARVQIPVQLNEMGAWLQRVTVAIEDRRFYHHSGID